MARPKSFAPDEALDAALRVFRAKGYEATTVQDLVAATGLSRSSLYNTFGGKHALYLAALDRYRALGREATAEALDCGGTSPLRALERYLRAVAAETGDGDAPPLGCLMTNAAAEVASRDPETAARAGASAREMTAALTQTVRDAQAAGEVDAPRDAQALGRFLTNAVYGLRGLQKAGASADVLDDVIETTLFAVRAS